MEYFVFVIIAVLIAVPWYLISAMKKTRNEQRKIDWHSNLKLTTLRIDVPKNNDKAPLSAEQMFAAIHGIYSASSLEQYHLSFELVAKDKFIQFYVTVPTHLKDFVEGQIYAQYPTVEISEVPDFTTGKKAHELNFSLCELKMTKPDVYPIRFFDSFDVDPLSGITSVMGKLGQNEEVWFQLVIKPVGDEWQDKGNSIVSSVRAGKKPGGQAIFDSFISGFKNFLKIFLAHAINPSAEIAEEKPSEIKLPSTVEEALKGIEQKITKLGFESKIRILCIANDPMTASVKCQSIAAAFKQFNTTNLNGFVSGEIKKNDFDAWQMFVNREFVDKGNIFNISELASIYHLPNQTVETPNIVWSGFKKGEPPANLPLDSNTPAETLTAIGSTNFRNVYADFGIKLDDRRRHIYIIGKSGTGKSTLIENMAIDDVYEGRGVIIVDPHGELAEKILSCVPTERIKDVIIFDPSDRGFPVAFNLLEMVDDDFKGMVASGFVGIFKKIFGESWGPRLEHILRNTVLALLDNPNSTMLDIPRMLTDNHFRDKVVTKVKDPVIRDFWVNEFAQYDAKFRTEAVSPILNKVGQFLATATIRNIVGQPHSKINIREIMDQKKILVVNLSRGKIGEDNSALLGAMMITKIQLAAMSRADVTVDKREDCFLYVDEFQNFATDSFAVILSEARKYNLCLTMANQYIEQMPESVRSAVFGNAGTIIAFRVGGTDASFLVREFEPVFDANDMVNLDKFNIYIKLLIDGISGPAFSARTFPPVQKIAGNADEILTYSRDHYSAPRALVEERIANRDEEEKKEMLAEAEAFKSGGLEALLVKKGTTPNTIPPAVETIEPKEIVPKKEEKEEKIIKEKTEKKPSKPRVFKYQNIIGDKIYKEQTAKGGVKWFIGESIDWEKMKETEVEIGPEAEKTIELAKKVAHESEHRSIHQSGSPSKIEKKEEISNSVIEDKTQEEETQAPNVKEDNISEKKPVEKIDDKAGESLPKKNDDIPKVDTDNGTNVSNQNTTQTNNSDNNPGPQVLKSGHLQDGEEEKL